MKNKEQQEIQLFGFVEQVKEKCNQAIDMMKSIEQLKEQIASMCVECFKINNTNCDKCNGIATNQLSLNFEEDK